MQPYEPGYKLKEDEYLLKIRGENSHGGVATGFLTKLTQKGAVPKSFDEWGSTPKYSYTERVDLPIYVVKETFRSGWKLYRWRFGESQNWASLIHPDGYTVEIYLQQFLDIVKNGDIIKGEIVGEFKWEDKKLIKNENASHTS